MIWHLRDSSTFTLSHKGTNLSRLTDLITEAKARDPQLGADLEREFRAIDEVASAVREMKRSR